eukprot:TRINITY_DN6128_c0_g1_i1.p1 TRINITY_DN6128_c0_g1~~TRINITY_DN6128_c0_g1_i1.p1  ORF type:complete len:228 (+),score=46.30 TRINITY_DN6128_c0_g1_i1:61-684(+)
MDRPAKRQGHAEHDGRRRAASTEKRRSHQTREAVDGNPPAKRAHKSNKIDIDRREKETDPHRLEQRYKKIMYGKNTVGYQNYLKAVPKRQRKSEHPRTPNAEAKVSKRKFDSWIKRWRLRLHEWDNIGESKASDEHAKADNAQEEESEEEMTMDMFRLANDDGNDDDDGENASGAAEGTTPATVKATNPEDNLDLYADFDIDSFLEA